jgi:predicted acylesterase/phospholipase RssA
MKQEHTKPSARKQQDGEKKEEPVIFHIVSGTSIGAINAAILVSYVKENRTWQGSGQRLIDFWKYLSTRSNVDNMDMHTLLILGTIGTDWIIALHQVSLPEDTIVPRRQKFS